MPLSEIHIPPVSGNKDGIQERSSPWMMIFTLLLLISGFILSSVLLLNYDDSLQARHEGAGASIFELAAQFGQGGNRTMQTESEPIPEKSVEDEPEALDSAVRRFFSGGNDGSVRWPKLKLTGFGKSSDAEGAFAIINGRQVLVNTCIDDVKLIEVRTHGAVVEYRGERKMLTLDSGR
jgi:hypothetical protein